MSFRFKRIRPNRWLICPAFPPITMIVLSQELMHGISPNIIFCYSLTYIDAYWTCFYIAYEVKFVWCMFHDLYNLAVCMCQKCFKFSNVWKTTWNLKKVQKYLDHNIYWHRLCLSVYFPKVHFVKLHFSRFPQCLCQKTLQEISSNCIFC